MGNASREDRGGGVQEHSGTQEHSRRRVDPDLQFIAASLGVECEFCHVQSEMDKDDKKAKKTAREMMRMFAVNQNNFSGEREVTCNTCHRGSIHPQAIPAIMIEATKPAAPEGDQDDAASLASWPPGNSVIAKYLEALGGKPALERVSTRSEKGNAVLAGGRMLPIEILAKAPDARVSVMHTANGDSVTAHNGRVGWLAVPGRPLREMSASDQYAARLDATVMTWEEQRLRIAGPSRVRAAPSPFNWTTCRTMRPSMPQDLPNRLNRLNQAQEATRRIEQREKVPVSSLA